ncbi:MAG: major capsid protein [Bacillota bacterium]
MNQKGMMMLQLFAVLHPLLKEFSRKKVLAYARAIPEEGHVGPTLFPVLPVNELTFEYWKDLNLLPVMASLQAYGAEAQIASREGAEKISGEIPPIKRKIYLAERAMLALKREGAGDADMVRSTIYNDIDNMVASVYARIEKMRMDVVAYGEMTLNENGVILSVNYGVPAEHKVVCDGGGNRPAPWSDAQNRDIIGNIQAWTEKIEADTGIRPTRALTSDTVVAHMLKDETIRQMIHGDLGSSRPISVQQVNQLLAGLDLPRIATYNRQVRAQAEDGTYVTMRYFPKHKFVLLPAQKLGDTLMGPTAEALLDEEVEAKDIAGIYACVTHENEPPMIWTKAAATSIPTFPMADAVFQADVIAAD